MMNTIRLSDDAKPVDLGKLSAVDISTDAMMLTFEGGGEFRLSRKDPQGVLIVDLVGAALAGDEDEAG